MLKKIGVIGGGNIGGVLVQEIAKRRLARSVGLMDILPPDFAKGKCLDIAEGTPIVALDVDVDGAKDYSVLKGAEIIINTAGVPRKKRPDGTIPTREELLKTNLNITAQVAAGIQEFAPDAMVISIANPLDAIVYTLHKKMKPPKNKLVGMAGVLDSSRYRYFVAKAAGVSVDNVEALVLGGHGDTMVPVRSCCRIAGVRAARGRIRCGRPVRRRSGHPGCGRRREGHRGRPDRCGEGCAPQVGGRGEEHLQGGRRAHRLIPSTDDRTENGPGACRRGFPYPEISPISASNASSSEGDSSSLCSRSAASSPPASIAVSSDASSSATQPGWTWTEPWRTWP